MQVGALYRIECLVDELGDGKDYPRLNVVSGRPGEFQYLVTGQNGKLLQQVFFTAPTPQAARHSAQVMGWKKIRLYQCERISL
jgi:hypothetical protein